MASSLIKKTASRKTSIFKDRVPPKLHAEKITGKYQHRTSQCDAWRIDKGQGKTSLTNLSIRYRELQHEYKNVLEEIKQKNALYESQKKEVQRLKKEQEKDQKQLYRLRCMLGFIKKNDVGLQVNIEPCTRERMRKIQTSVQGSFQKQASTDGGWTPKKSKRAASPLMRQKSPTDKSKISGEMFERTEKKRYEGSKKSSIYKDNSTEELFSALSEKTLKHPISKHSQTYYEKNSLIRQIKKITNSSYQKLRFKPSPDLP